jgi:putative acetyltransferase
MNIRIEPAGYSHESQILCLYEKVADAPNGLIRLRSEIRREYISGFLSNSIENGIILAGFSDDQIVGEIHAYTPDIFAFHHILTDLTIVVDPEFQRKGIGRSLFEEFLKVVRKEYNHILRIELYVREHSKPVVRFYESIGFINEGRQENKIITTDGLFETPLHMAWFNPDYRSVPKG